MKLPVAGRRVFFAIFAISGFSGLIYESIWSHYLKLFLGHAAYAQTLVLAIFMGGMALGSWLVARYSIRLRNLLLGYVVAEAITGLVALFFHAAHVGLVSFAFDSVIPGLESMAAINTFKWSLAALMILPQSILLGTTFPLISGGLIRRFPERSGETLAMLYFTNSLGAALGILASGFVLIAAVGLPGTVMTAGIINIALAVFVWLLSRGAPEPFETARQPAAPDPALASTGRWIVLAALLSGFAAFVYEIAWIRMLSLVLGASTHSFELMLSAFILGLALGGWWIRRRVDQYADPLRPLAIMFALMAGLAALTLPAYGYAFDVMERALQMFSATDEGYAGFNIVSHAIAAALMMPTTFVAGMTLPLMTHYLLRSGYGERSIGIVYAANTVGAIAGVMVAVHLLLPWVGTKGAILLGALTQVGVATMLFSRSTRSSLQGWPLGSVAASVAVIAAVALLVRLDPMQMASGVYRGGQASLPKNAEVTYFRDGKTATISLAQQGGVVSIATNGKTDATINLGEGAALADEITMTLAAALPLSMHPEAKRIANIGIGSGLTSQVLLTSDVVASVDSIEIEPAVAEAAWIGFGLRVERLFMDPRSHIHFEDAKTFFASHGVRYDVIVSEPSNPWVSGVASLFSDEFYGQVTRYLTDDGLLVQWLQVYETDIKVIASVMKALSPHFADYAIFNTDDANLVIVASHKGAVPPLTEGIFNSPALAAELARVGLESVADIEQRRIAGKRLLEPLFASFPVPKNSDYFPFVDLTAPKMRFLRRNAQSLSELNSLPVPIGQLVTGAAQADPIRRQSQLSFLARERQAQQALEIRLAMETGNLGSVSSPVVRDLMLLSADGRECADAQVRAAWMFGVENLASRTTPYLSGASLAGIWRRIRATPCHAALSEGERTWIAMLEGLALRDSGRILEGGATLLGADASALTADQALVVLLGTAATLVGEGRSREALQLMTERMQMIGDPGQYELAVRWITALAAAGRPEG